MKRILLITTIILVSIFLNANDISYQIPRILIIQSYHSGFLWTDNVDIGIKSTLKKYNNNVRIRTEFLDTKRFTSPEFKANLKMMLEYKYKDSSFDVVIVVDNNAFELVKQLHDTVFKDTPVVFCGLNFFEPSQLGDMKNVTGVREKIVSLENFQLIKKLHKNVEKIIVINEMTPTGAQNKLNIMSDIRDFKEDVEVEIVEDISAADLKEKLRNLSANTVVLYSLFLRDNQGHFLEYDESIRLVTESANVPVYVSIDFSLGYGAVGGFLTSGTLQGESAARLAIEILEGANADKLDIIDISPNGYYFDYLSMQKWGIKRRDLPENSIIINYNDSYFSKNKKLILRFSSLVLILAGIIFWLIITLVKKNRLKNELLNSNESLINLKKDLEVIVKDRTNELEDERNFISTVQDNEGSLLIVFHKDGKIKSANRFAITSLEFDEDSIVGQSLWQIFDQDNDVTNVKKFISGAKEDKSKFVKQLKLISKNGKNLIIESVITSITVTGKKYFILTGTNVTEKYYLFKQLEREEKKYRTVYENSGIAMVTYGENDFVVMLNKKFEELSGYSREEAVNKMRWQDLVDESSKDLIQTNRNLRSQNKLELTDDYEIKLLNKKGFVRDVLISVVLVPETKELICSVTDITEKNAVQNKMKLLIEHQKAFNEAKNEYYRNVGQDLSTPINTIHGLLDLVKYAQDRTEIETYLKVLQGLTRQVYYMVNEMANYQFSYKPEDLDIQEASLHEFIINSTKLFLSRSDVTKIFFKLDEKLQDRQYIAVHSLEKLLQILILIQGKRNIGKPITISVSELDDEYLRFIVTGEESEFNDSSYTEVVHPKNNKIYKLEYLSNFSFSYFVISALISSMGGNLEIDYGYTKNNEYSFTIKKFRKEDITKDKHLHNYVNRIESLILPRTINDELSINSESLYPLKILMVNYNKTDHYALNKILEVLNQKVDICLPEHDLKELISKTSYDMIIFDFSRMSINNLHTLKEIRDMKNIYQPFIIGIKPYQMNNETYKDIKLINGQIPEILNIVDIAEFIKQANNFKAK